MQHVVLSRFFCLKYYCSIHVLFFQLPVFTHTGMFYAINLETLFQFPTTTEFILRVLEQNKCGYDLWIAFQWHTRALISSRYVLKYTLTWSVQGRRLGGVRGVPVPPPFRTKGPLFGSEKKLIWVCRRFGGQMVFKIALLHTIFWKIFRVRRKFAIYKVYLAANRRF